MPDTQSQLPFGIEDMKPIIQISHEMRTKSLPLMNKKCILYCLLVHVRSTYFVYLYTSIFLKSIAGLSTQKSKKTAHCMLDISSLCLLCIDLAESTAAVKRVTSGLDQAIKSNSHFVAEPDQLTAACGLIWVYVQVQQHTEAVNIEHGQ